MTTETQNMPTPIVIVDCWENHLHHFLRELKAYKKIPPEHYLVSASFVEIRKKIEESALQLLVVGGSEPEELLAHEMKAKNPQLKVVRLAFFEIGGIKSPFDMYVTWAHPDLTYKEILKDVFWKFLSDTKVLVP